MAHTKAQGSVKGNRDSLPKNLGVKVYGGGKVIPGNIIVRQKGTKFFPGDGAKMGKDYTIYSMIEGVVSYKMQRGKKLVVISNG